MPHSVAGSRPTAYGEATSHPSAPGAGMPRSTARADHATEATGARASRSANRTAGIVSPGR